MSNPEDFTVGWICALATEYVAARAFLDDELPDVTAVAPNDNNEYTLGIMGRHHIVIASLPDGEYGLSSAAAVTRDMMSTFTNIRVRLMVGIGGGAPTLEHPIRLGDVVVSRPSDNHGGVFQYDFGKTIQEQDFQHTRFLNQPPTVLLTALNGLKVRYEANGHKLQENIRAVLDKKPRLQKKYSQPSVDSDRLYHSNLIHPPQKQGSCADLCGINPEHIVERKQRDAEEDDPQIYYGLIASANSLMKDAVLRDKLASEREVLCFEMEAAGLMNHFPCLVIRGICDYSDTHKNKAWQGYAAMTAVAYAKDLLGRVAPEKGKETESVMKAIGKTADAIAGLQSDVKEIPKLQIQQMEHIINSDQRELLPTLKRCDYESFKERNPPKAPGTCTWVRQHQRYLEWKENIGSDLLWVSADPGCGKSVLARAFIDDPDFNSPDSITCYFFFKDNNDQNSLAVAFCSLLHQIFSQQPELLSFTTDAWRKIGQQLCEDVNELWRIFRNVALASGSRQMFCIIDALDECRDDERPKLLGLLQDLYHDARKQSIGQAQCTKLIVTSRPYSDLEQQFDSIPEIRLRGEDENETLREEIDLVIKERVRKLAEKEDMTYEVQNRLEQKLLGMEHRTYLWLYLAFADIERRFEDSLVLESVDIETLPTSVHDAYAKMLAKIEQSGNKDARTALGIILGARRPLSIGEFAYALGVALTDEVRNLEAVVFGKRLEKWIRKSCNLFVHFNNKNVYLIHQTAKEFLVQSNQAHHLVWSLSFTDTEIEMLLATICIKALCSDFTEDDRAEESHHMGKSFVDYCAEFWLSHSRDVYQSLLHSFEKQIDKLHETQSRRFEYWFRVYWQRNYIYDDEPHMTRCRLCGFTGHVNWLAQSLDYQNHEIDIADSKGRNALYWACNRGNLGAAHELLLRGADINAKGGEYGTALQAALAGGHIEITKLLVNEGADVNAKGGEYDNALLIASAQGDVEIVKLLVDKGADINARGKYVTALQAALARGHIEITKLLVNEGADVNAKGGEYGNALQAASAQGHIEIVKLLVNKDADINTKGGYYGNALQAASAQGDIKIVKLLVNKGADVNAKGGYYGNALQAALDGGDIEIIKLLLDKGAEINFKSKGEYYSTALQAASARGDIEIVKLLVNKGADTNTKGGECGTALQAASAKGHIEIIKLLIDKGANVNAKGKYYSTALDTASFNGYIEIVKLLLNEGADINAKGGKHGTALQAASAQGYIEIVKLLVNEGADVNTEGGEYGTALQAASAEGYIEIVRLLVNRGADVNAVYGLHQLKTILRL